MAAYAAIPRNAPDDTPREFPSVDSQDRCRQFRADLRSTRYWMHLLWISYPTLMPRAPKKRLSSACHTWGKSQFQEHRQSGSCQLLPKITCLRKRTNPSISQGSFGFDPISRCRSSRQQPLQRPLFAGDSRLNRWRGLQSHVLSAPVVPSEVQAEHRIVIASLLAETIRQPRKPAKRHAGCQVESFHATGPNFVFWNGTADHRFRDRCYSPW